MLTLHVVRQYDTEIYMVVQHRASHIFWQKEQKAIE